MRPSSLVRSPDGTRLAVYDTGGPGPVVVAVHGYPDNAAVWDGVVDELAGSMQVVRYDVRGCGASDKPRARSAYRIERLVDDLASVLDAVAADRVHLVGHDWGSVQAWPALTDARIRGRVRDFVSISGPSLDHVTHWVRRSALRQPGLVLKQAVNSSYVALFQLPWLPELLIDRGVAARAVQRRSGRRAAAFRSDADFRNGLQLYRANIATLRGRPAAEPIDVPVLVLVLTGDEALDPRVCVSAAEPWVAQLTTRSLPGGHWLMLQRPGEIARCLTAFWDAR
jgi:pimeloyl-ACP methyl ester carboxylesterase